MTDVIVNESGKDGRRDADECPDRMDQWEREEDGRVAQRDRDIKTKSQGKINKWSEATCSPFTRDVAHHFMHGFLSTLHLLALSELRAAVADGRARGAITPCLAVILPKRARVRVSEGGWAQSRQD